MRSLLAVLAPALLAGCQSLQSPQSAPAQVSAATQAWSEAFNACDPARSAALYGAEPLLWGTVAPTLITTRDGVRQYFERACAAPTPPKVVLGESTVRLHGDTAVAAGTYTFVVTVGGQPRQLPARYSFTWRRVDGQWRIVEHHSSAMPAAPSGR